MTRKLLLPLALGLCLTNGVRAAPEQLGDMLFENQRRLDEKGIATGPNTRALMADCDISRALRFALTGDSKALAAALEEAEANLRKAGDGLRSIAEKNLFSHDVSTSGLTPSSPYLRRNKITNGNDVVNAIAELAIESADLIARLRTSSSREDDLTALVQNNADISQLILVFYGLLVPRSKT